MEKLKSVLADKILEISDTGGDNVTNRLDKVQRFRDFSNACQSLMMKYPEIENELIKMVNENDFDTKIASSRVDSVIRLSHNGNSSEAIVDKEKQEVIDRLEEIADQFDPEIVQTQEKLLPEGEAVVELPEEEIQEKKIYTEYEDVVPLTIEQNNKETLLNKKNINRVIQICGVILILIILFFIIKFVKEHWQAVLYTLGGIAIVAVIVWILIKRNRNRE